MCRRRSTSRCYGASTTSCGRARRLLAVLGAQAWEGRELDWLVPGAEMYWSHYGPDDYITMAERVGIRVLATDIEPDPIDGAHLFLLAEKPKLTG